MPVIPPTNPWDEQSPWSSHDQFAPSQLASHTWASAPRTIVRATQFFEFVKSIGDFSTDGNKILVPPALTQPMAADDVASEVGRVVLGSPLNGTVEIAGPERFRLDELIRLDLAARKDPREVITAPRGRYYGIKVTENALIPGDAARLGERRFEDWLSQVTKQIPNPHLQPA
jgi:uncharacterized protein YbjT (DUF2867 family)